MTDVRQASHTGGSIGGACDEGEGVGADKEKAASLAGLEGVAQTIGWRGCLGRWVVR